MGSHSITDSNRLILKRPDLAEEWSLKNSMGPNEVAINCTKLSWWKCKKCNFEWQTKAVYRNNYVPTGKNGRTHISKKYPPFRFHFPNFY